MAAHKLIIDCDPGVDDAVALLLALSARDALDIVAITAVSGNVGLDLTARNACIVRDIAGRADVPVHAGCAQPLLVEAGLAEEFHGPSGLGDLPIAQPKAPVADEHAVDAIIRHARAAAPGELSIAVTGPCTNVATAFLRDPEIATRFAHIVIMGGAKHEGGNVTASAEFNIWADPHAADVVLQRGANIVLLGLDVTHGLRATPARIAALEALGNARATAAAQLLRFSTAAEDRFGVGGGAPLHDPATIAWLLAPELFAGRPAQIGVEVASPLTRGHTAVEQRGRPGFTPNALWIESADADAVFALLTERLA
jgi:purine nucleosidase